MIPEASVEPGELNDVESGEFASDGAFAINTARDQGSFRIKI
jgi:hypothetical protein